MPKKKFTNPLHIEFGNGFDVRDVAASIRRDPQTKMAEIKDMIEKGDLKWSNVRDLRALFNHTIDLQVPGTVEVLGEKRAISTSAFPLLSGSLTVAALNDAYEALPNIAADLVTDMEDAKRVTEIAAVSSQDVQIARVDEGQDFPEIGAGEERYEIRSNRNGRRLSVTAEMIEENNVSGIVDKINQLAEICNEFVEDRTISLVTDNHGSATAPAEPYALRLNGTGTQLYNSSANNPGTRAPSGTRVNNNALEDETDLDNARVVLAAMLNTRGRRISIPMNRCVLFVPDALVGTAGKILNSEYTPGVENEWSPWGPRGDWRPRLLSTPKLDDYSTTAWYLGDFKRQFVGKWKLRMEYVTLGMDTQAFLQSRIAFQARVAWDYEVGARDYVYVVQSLSATTAPTAR